MHERHAPSSLRSPDLPFTTPGRTLLSAVSLVFGGFLDASVTRRKEPELNSRTKRFLIIGNSYGNSEINPRFRELDCLTSYNRIDFLF